MENYLFVGEEVVLVPPVPHQLPPLAVVLIGVQMLGNVRLADVLPVLVVAE